MAAITPPWAIQASSHPAERVRQSLQGLLGSPTGIFVGGTQATTGGGGHGIISSPDLAVTQNGSPNMSVNVAIGQVVIRGTENAVQGCYGPCYNDATLNVVIAASDPTNPRRDLIVAKIRDQSYSGASNDFSIVAVTGTPAGSPVDPAVPNNGFVIARIAVAALVTSIVNANITDLRTRASALGGTQVCTSTTRPTGASLYAGLTIFETDTNNVMLYTGATWTRVEGPGPWLAYTPTWSGTLNNGTMTAAYQRIGRTVNFRIELTWGSTTSHPAATQSMTLPVAPSGFYGTAHTVGIHTAFQTGTNSWSGPSIMISGSTIQGGGGISQTGTAAGQPTNLVPFTWANTHVWYLIGTYEASAD